MDFPPLIIILGFLAGILLVFLAIGSFAKSRLKKKYPPPGQMVDIGGYNLHLLEKGEGSPVVVLDAGAGEFSLMWHLVQNALAKDTRVVAYDRAGLGWSDPSPRPRSTFAMMEELRLLLQKAGIPAPYLLVGASLGGLNAKFYAHCYPEEVAGLVLVDAAHEDQYQPKPLQEAIARMKTMMAVMSGAQKVISATGLSALFPRLSPGSLPASFPVEVRRAHWAARVMDKRNTLTSLAEINQVMESHAQVRAENITSLGDLPLVVIQHGKKQTQMMPGVDEIMEETNKRLQTATAGLSTCGKLIVAENSGHDVVRDEPEVVIEAIRSVMTQLRERRNEPLVE